MASFLLLLLLLMKIAEVIATIPVFFLGFFTQKVHLCLDCLHLYVPLQARQLAVTSFIFAFISPVQFPQGKKNHSTGLSSFLCNASAFSLRISFAFILQKPESLPLIQISAFGVCSLILICSDRLASFPPNTFFHLNYPPSVPYRCSAFN